MAAIRTNQQTRKPCLVSSSKLKLYFGLQELGKSFVLFCAVLTDAWKPFNFSVMHAARNDKHVGYSSRIVHKPFSVCTPPHLERNIIMIQFLRIVACHANWKTTRKKRFWNEICLQWFISLWRRLETVVLKIRMQIFTREWSCTLASFLTVVLEKKNRTRRWWMLFHYEMMKDRIIEWENVLHD